MSAFLLPSRLREGSGEGLFAPQTLHVRVCQPLPQPLPQAGGEL